MARVLIVGDSQRALGLAGGLLDGGHAVRVVSDRQDRCGAIERIGAECFPGTPERPATMRGALEHVTIACWLLSDPAQGRYAEEALRALHESRLERFLCDAIDSTLRGFVYDAGGSTVPPDALEQGRRIVSETGARNSIPIAVLEVDPEDVEQWTREAGAAVGALLGEPVGAAAARYAG